MASDCKFDNYIRACSIHANIIKINLNFFEFLNTVLWINNGAFSNASLIASHAVANGITTQFNNHYFVYHSWCECTLRVQLNFYTVEENFRYMFNIANKQLNPSCHVYIFRMFESYVRFEGKDFFITHSTGLKFCRTFDTISHSFIRYS
jgi:hypothetical protein